jgi:glycosyltransferase involved in cell wall biosynthesis
MFSMTPLFADRSMGGAQKQLRKVALHLAQQGHEVQIFCTRRHPDALEPFHWHANAVVRPVLRFKQPFPEPYDTPVYNIANAIADVIEACQNADAFYSHDGGLTFPFVYTHTRSVVSLRSVLFSETLQSGFLFNADALIVPSVHTANVWLATAGQFYPQLAERMHVIPNGLDFMAYHPDAGGDTLQARLGLPVGRYLLYPHRPEDGKGIRQSIALLDRLVNTHQERDLYLLVPQWIDTALAPHVRAYYDGLLADIDARGLRDHVIFHPWINDEDMPAYFRLGAVTLVLGNYVETFGNTPYESLACGTPAIVANVAAYRGALPDTYTCDYGDLETATTRALRFLNEGDAQAEATLRWLHTRYQQADMVQRYEQLILEPTRLPPLPHSYQTPSAYQWAPWCYVTPQGQIYHDFLGRMLDNPALIAAMAEGSIPADHPLVPAARAEGLIVPAHLPLMSVG